MGKKLIFFMVVIAVMLAAGLVLATGKESEKRSDTLYVCDCSPECKCNTVSVKPGECTCGNKLKAMHVLKIKGDEAMLCTCGAGCGCKIDPNDPTKCGCGKPVKKVSIKGLYVCNCSPGCNCNTVSDTPGKCGCGVDLKKVE